MAEHNVQQHFDRSVSQASFGRLRAEFFNAHSNYQGLCGAQHGTTQAGLGRPGNDAMNAGNVLFYMPVTDSSKNYTLGWGGVVLSNDVSCA
eukprot:757747-Hanusia_phi.AAC.4